MTGRLPTRAEAIDAAAQVLVDGLAEADRLTPEDAARAAGARSPDDIAALAAQIRAEREQLLRSSA